MTLSLGHDTLCLDYDSEPGTLYLHHSEPGARSRILKSCPSLQAWDTLMGHFKSVTPSLTVSHHGYMGHYEAQIDTLFERVEGYHFQPHMSF